MAKCSKCGSEVRAKPIANADLLTLGVPVLIKSGISKLYCKTCKASEMVVPNMAGLVAASAISLAAAPYKLDASELVFLRKSIGLSAKNLADDLGVAAETVSRWENGKQPVGDAQERLMRLQVVSRLRDKAPGIQITLDDVLALKVSPMRQPHAKPHLSYERSNKADSHTDGGLYQAAR